jgi:nicotinamidase-related amidase
MIQQKTNTALLVMDMQERLLSSLVGSDQMIPKVSKAIDHARKNGIPVIYVVVGFRQGFPEISPENKSFSQLPTRMAGVDVSAFMKIAPGLEPKAQDITVIKKRFSAFAGSDLEIVLRSKGIRHLVLCGVVTSGVVLSTYTEAADKDYQLTILSDGCMDRDAQVHELLVGKVFPRSAAVVSCEEWCR